MTLTRGSAVYLPTRRRQPGELEGDAELWAGGRSSSAALQADAWSGLLVSLCDMSGAMCSNDPFPEHPILKQSTQWSPWLMGNVVGIATGFYLQWVS